MAICLVCKKDIQVSGEGLNGDAFNSDLFREKNIHRHMHLVTAGTESIIFLEDLVSADKFRLTSSIKEKERLTSIVDTLKRSLWIEPLFDDEE